MVNIRRPRVMPELTREIMRRWRRQVWCGLETDCWIWIGSRTVGGYGQMRLPGHFSKFLAHRIGYVWRFGPVPGRGLLMHVCDNPGCVNPYHLSSGSPHENAWDRIQKGRQGGCVEVVRSCPF